MNIDNNSCISNSSTGSVGRRFTDVWDHVIEISHGITVDTVGKIILLS